MVFTILTFHHLGCSFQGLPVLRPAIHFVLVPVQAIIGSKIFATPLAVKHTATVMITCVLIKCGGYLQRFENLVTDITGVKQFFLVFCSVVFQQFLAAVKPLDVLIFRQRCPSNNRCSYPAPP